MANSVIHRHAVISRISDAKIVAEMDIDCRVVKGVGGDYVFVDVEVDHKSIHMNGETHHKQFSMRKDVYYNLPKHIHDILKEEDLDDPLYSSPIEDSGHACPMVFDMLTAIRDALGDGSTRVDLDRYLSESQFVTK